jgi:hypothetical protein
MIDPGSKEWYYVGHYGQLGPLTWDQFSQLVGDSVIERETFVWATGMDSWRPAGTVPELMTLLPPPTSVSQPPPFTPGVMSQAPVAPVMPNYPTAPMYSNQMPTTIQGYVRPDMYATLPVSDKSRMTAGLLNFIPGVGRIYLGYTAIGVIQLLLTLICLVPVIWAWVDAISMLSGNVKIDGYGRRLER